MERVEDSINGRRIAVVYGAEQFELSRAAGRWARSRQVRREAKRCGATHLLRVGGVGGDHETWWLGQAGVSFAAAIEGWAAQREDVDDDVVLVPLDDRIYAAELGGGEVDEEMVIGEGLLPEQFRKWRGRTVRGFEAGDLGEVLADTAVALEPLPFDPRAMVYRPAVVALTAAGLFAPAQAAYAAAVVGLVAGWQFFEEWRAGAVDEAVEASREAEARALALQGDFSGAAVVDGFAERIWDERLLVLHRDGLRTASFASAFEVVYSGDAIGYPKSAERYAVARGAGFTVSGSSWRVAEIVGWGGPVPGSVAGIGGKRLAANFYAIAAIPRAVVSGTGAVPAELTEERSFTVRIEGPTRRDFEALAGGMDGLPYRVAAASCQFEDYLATFCDLTVVAKGVLE